MKLLGIDDSGSFGLYSVDSGEQKAVKKLLGYSLDPVHLRRSKFEEVHTGLFADFPLDKVDEFDSRYQNEGDIIVHETHLQGQSGLLVAVDFKEHHFDRRDAPYEGWFRGNFRTGTVCFATTQDPAIIAATVDISRGYGVVGQHETGVRSIVYSRNVVDDLVDLLADNSDNPHIRSPKGRGFVPAGITQWEDFLARYAHAKKLLAQDSHSGGWTLDEWKKVRHDKVHLKNPVFREMSKTAYLNKLSSLLQQ